jgi:phosphoglycerate dehydrogenase-like enzyme
VTGSRPRVLVVAPEGDGRRDVGGVSRYFHGGIRYRAIADEILGPQADVVHEAWMPDESAGDWSVSFDTDPAMIDGIVLAPWLMNLSPFDGERLDRVERLRVIAGTFDYRLDWIDVEDAARHGVTVIDTSRTMTPTVAEFGVAISLALLRDIPAAIEVVRDGRWPEAPKAEDRFVFRDLADCRVGLAGYGTINRHYRQFVSGFGCEVSTYDPFVDEATLAADDTRGAASLVDLASASDILVVAIPPTPSTLGVIDAAVIDALPTGSLFVLLSRMAVVEQEALWRRVRGEELRAAVDVYDPEPPASDAWFRSHPDVLPTPHIAGNVQFAHERCFREACVDAGRVLRGGSPHHAASGRDQHLYAGSLRDDEG